MSARAPMAADPLLGRIVDSRWRIDGPLGEGGVATVYVGMQLGLGRKVAIKVLREAPDGRARLRERFILEAKTLAALSHPNIVGVLDFGTFDDMPFIVMELVEGVSLRARIDQGPIGTDRALDLARQILRALVYAHGKGVVHRDLKPSNVGLVRSADGAELVKILDFGFAKFVGPKEATGPELTEVGMAIGTPWYVAPEQVSAKPTDGRADLYSLGAMLFEMLTGKRPFEGPAMEVIRAHLVEPAPTMRETRPDLGLSPALDAIVSRALQKEPGDRFADAASMLAAIDAAAPPATASAVPPAPSARITGSEPTVEAPATPLQVPLPTLRPLPATSERRWPAIALVVFAGVLFATAALPMIFSRPHAPPPATARPPTGPPPELVMDFTPAETTAVRVPPADPWRRPLPREIAKLGAKIRRGAKVDPSALLPLGRYARAHRDDPRPHLLLAYAYRDRNWNHDAILRYLTAVRIDPSSRGDPRMLRDLVRVASLRPGGEEAGQAIWTIYRDEEIPAIERAIAAMQGRPEAERLTRIVEDIRRRAARE